MSTTPPDPYSSSSRGKVNPFAPPETLDQSSDSWNSQLTDLPSDSPRIPPIEASYFWAGGALLAVSYFLGISSFASIVPFIASLLALTFAIMRLVMHRLSIGRAIRDGRYRASVRFDYRYLIVSLVIGAFSVFSAGVVFFLVCAAGPIDHRIPYNFFPSQVWLFMAGILSLATAFFVNILSVPRYR